MGSFKRSPLNGEISIWVSRVDALNQQGNELSWDSEAGLIKRYFRSNHEHRTGLCRLPDKAYGALGFDFDEQERIDEWRTSLLRLFDSYLYVAREERPAFDGGGEYFAEYSHGNGADQNVVYSLDDVYLAPAQIRHNALMSCGSNRVGGLVTKMLFTRHSAITSGASNYYHTDEGYMDCLIAGQTYGQASIQHPNSSSVNLLVGDWSLKPKMFPANATPRIRRFTIVDNPTVTGVPTRFAIDAYDNDGTLDSIELYPEGWGHRRDLMPWQAGEYEPVVYAFSDTITYTYEKTGRFPVRVLVADNYKGWAWREDTITVNQGSSHAGPVPGVRVRAPEMIVVMGDVVKRIPVEAFPATLRVFSPSGRQVLARTVRSARERVMLHDVPAVCVIKIDAPGATKADFVVRF